MSNAVFLARRRYALVCDFFEHDLPRHLRPQEKANLKRLTLKSIDLEAARGAEAAAEAKKKKQESKANQSADELRKQLKAKAAKEEEEFEKELIRKEHERDLRAARKRRALRLAELNDESPKKKAPLATPGVGDMNDEGAPLSAMEFAAAMKFDSTPSQPETNGGM